MSPFLFSSPTATTTTAQTLCLHLRVLFWFLVRSAALSIVVAFAVTCSTRSLCCLAPTHSHSHALSLSLMCTHTHRGIHRLPTHSLACFSSLSPLHCVAVAAAAAAAAALASTLRCPHSHNNNENNNNDECTTTCNNMHVHEPRQRRSVAALPLCSRSAAESRSHRRLCSLLI